MDDATLGRVFRDDAPFELLTDLAGLQRFGGSPGEQRAAKRVARALTDAGLDPRIEPFEIQRWKRGGSTLTVGSDPERPFETVALPYSPAADLSGPLVDAGHGTPADCEGLEGAVAVVSTATPPGADRHVHRMEKCGHAADAGARAVVFAGDRPGQLPPTGALRFGSEVGGSNATETSEPGAATEGAANSGRRATRASRKASGNAASSAAINTPAVGVSHETGEWLREYAAREVEASLSVDAATEAGESQNVRASFGPDTDEAIILVAHYDAHDVGEGALDNGCGVAVLLGAVRALVDANPGCRVEVAATGCEEIGLLGAEALADSTDPDGVRAVVNVDGAGRFRDLRALTHAHEGLPAVVQAVAADLPDPVAVEERPHPWSDHWPLLRAGVPTVQLHSASPGEDGVWDRGWTHTRADTRDKVDPRNIREHAALAALLVERIAKTPLDRIDPVTVRERLRAAGAEPGMRAAGVWPAGWE